MKAYIIKHPRSKDLIISCDGKCQGDCDDIILSNKECADNLLDCYPKGYKVYEVIIKLT